jgi:hypothetical protein
MAKEKLTPADKKFIEKFFGEVNFDATDIIRENRFSGVKISVDPVFAKCFDFVLNLEEAMVTQSEVKMQKIHPSLKMTNAVSNFDRARMIALKMDADAYMELLD